MNNNYKELGFMCGLEIHQQIEGKKLFCNCPTTIRKDKPDYTFFRKLRAAAGETGKIDKAAKYEMEKSKIFEYQGYYNTICLVEQDEEPPSPVNEDAVNIALQVAKLLNMTIVDSIQFMRKTVIDGSNVSGFQRTALIGYDGFIEVNGRKIDVESICLEEEAAQVIKRTEEKDIYNLSRLGIPLLEIATAPDITTPEECKSVAAHIGMLLRSTGKMKRGIGSIRQDVNVSIRGGARTEIKGFQDIKSIPRVINNEIDRQLKLIKKGEKIESGVRKAEPDGTTKYLRPMPGADRMYPETDIPTIIPNTKNIKTIETLEDKQKRYEKEYDLSSDLASMAVKYEPKTNKNFEIDFKEFSKVPPKTIVDTVLIKIPTLEKKEKADFGAKKWLFVEELFSAIEKGIVSASSIPDVLSDFVKTHKFSPEKYKQMDDKELKKIIKKIISENKDAPRGLIMGKVMGQTKGKADGKKVNEIVSKLL